MGSLKVLSRNPQSDASWFHSLHTRRSRKKSPIGTLTYTMAPWSMWFHNWIQSLASMLWLPSPLLVICAAMSISSTSTPSAPLSKLERFGFNQSQRCTYRGIKIKGPSLKYILPLSAFDSKFKPPNPIPHPTKVQKRKIEQITKACNN